MLEAFTAHLPVEITFGDGCVSSLPGALARHGVSRPFIVIEEPVADHPGIAAALAAAPAGRRFVKPSGEPTMVMFEDCVEAFSASGTDGIVAIGGGSAIDLSRATRAVVGYGSTCDEVLAGRVEARPPHVPLISVPTTSGTGADLTGAFVIKTADGRKRAWGNSLLRGQASLIDPELTLGLPAAPTLHGGVDAMAHCVAACMVVNRSPFSVAVACEGLRNVAAGLTAAVRDPSDIEARRHMSLACMFGGLAINLADCSAEHALGHGLGGVYGLPHGLAVGLLLAECLETNRPARIEELERIGEALGEPADDARDGSRGIRAVRRVLADAGFPVPAGIGVGDERMDELVAISLDDYCLTTNPVPWGAAEVEDAFRRALAVTAR
ncbi:MAG: choline dehydrogenase [Gaiellaceae bacterium]|nr:choline dehydrogenase [Gaiellaceae bacterium]